MRPSGAEESLVIDSSRVIGRVVPSCCGAGANAPVAAQSFPIFENFVVVVRPNCCSSFFLPLVGFRPVLVHSRSSLDVRFELVWSAVTTLKIHKLSPVHVA